MRIANSCVNHRVLSIADVILAEYKRCFQGGDHEQISVRHCIDTYLLQSKRHGGEQV
jgi:hypothetical protein